MLMPTSPPRSLAVFFLEAAGGAMSRQSEQVFRSSPTKEGIRALQEVAAAATRWTATEPEGMVASVDGDPAWMETIERTGHARQPRSSMPGLTSSVDSASVDAPADPARRQ